MAEFIVTVEQAPVLVEVGGPSGGVIVVENFLQAEFEITLLGDTSIVENAKISAQQASAAAAISAAAALISESNAESFSQDVSAEAVAASLSATAAAASQAAASGSATAAAGSATTATSQSNAATDAKNYAIEWANKAENSLVSLAAGGNGTTDYSSKHQALKATASATIATTKAGEASASAAAALASQNAASTSATNAASSASTVTTQASTATTKANEASTSATNAAASATTAANQATISTTQATASNDSKLYSAEWANKNVDTLISVAAGGNNTTDYSSKHHATKAFTSATNAAASATTATTQATIATTKAGEATTSAAAALVSQNAATGSATAAAGSATAANTSANNASSSASAAVTQATTATTQASNAAASATTAATQAGISTTQAGISTTKASEASSSAADAIAAKAAAEAAKDAALAAFDNFDDKYLGEKVTDPTLDNDGNALVSGALYFNSVAGAMKVYTGTAWVAAYASLAGALIATNNLSDLTSVSLARTNLGLGTAATTAASAYATAAQGTKADTALQAAAIGDSVQGYAAVLAGTTSSFTSALKTKLDGIEAGATGDMTGAEIQAALLAVGGGGSGGIEYIYANANVNAEDKKGILADTLSSSFTVTLPAGPALGEQVVIADPSNYWGVNNLTVARNGSTIAGLLENLVCDISGVSIQLVYSGSTWRVYAQVGGNSGTGTGGTGGGEGISEELVIAYSVALG